MVLRVVGAWEGIPRGWSGVWECSLIDFHVEPWRQIAVSWWQWTQATLLLILHEKCHGCNGDAWFPLHESTVSCQISPGSVREMGTSKCENLAERADSWVPLLTNMGISLIMKRRLYSSCVRSSMLHGSETWPVRKENKVAVKQAEMRMVRWMCAWHK